MANSAVHRNFSWLSIAVALFAGAVVALPTQAQTVPLTLGAIPPEDVVPLAKDGLERALADLPAAVESVLKRSGVPGAAVAVVHGGKTVFARGFGVRELGKDATVDTATVFQIASMSKPIAATIAATQVSAGTVKWDDRIVQHLPTFAVGDAYVTANGTIGDFYAHRSGLPHAAGDTLEDIGFDRTTILERLRMLPLEAFRTSYNYANFGYTTGAEAVAAAAGKAWADLAQQALYGPLGMTSTSSRYADFLARENRATLHELEGSRFVAGFKRDPDQQSPAGGVTSNVVDLAKWAALILANGRHDGREMIAPAALLPALRSQAFSSPARTIGSRSGFYGFGFNVSVNANGRPDMSHSGAFVTGAATNVQFVPSADLAIIVLTNAGPVGAAEAISSHFLDIVQYGAVTRDWYALMHPLLMQNYASVGDLVGKTAPASPAPARPLADYVGTYDSPYFGPARISQGENGLVLTLGPAAITMPMTHWDGDVFSIAPRSENAPYGSLSSVRFEGLGGALKSMRIDYLNDEGLATWTR
ncbi:MAG: serine hydrolase [Xanthobacteraceae bacterium]|jgi:CubicO group peptidase (beta-lactamase class C family)|nr:serine hydrolase [Xanthobacteraceae bacterium]